MEPLASVHERPADQEYAQKASDGHTPKPARLAFEAVVYVLRTGCRWKALPKERFCGASAIHRRFLEWECADAFEAIWATGLAEYDQIDGRYHTWRWQSLDGALFKAPLARVQIGAHPTDQKKQGCAGPQYARRDIPVALAPSVSAQLMISPLRSEMPRPSCGRAVRFSGAQEARPQ